MRYYYDLNLKQHKIKEKNISIDEYDKDYLKEALELFKDMVERDKADNYIDLDEYFTRMSFVQRLTKQLGGKNE